MMYNIICVRYYILRISPDCFAARNGQIIRVNKPVFFFAQCASGRSAVGRCTYIGIIQCRVEGACIIRDSRPRIHQIEQAEKRRSSRICSA